LTTKYTIPPQRTDTIVRPRLLDQLGQGLARKLTLVVAPAGYGKTSLLSAWATSLAERQKAKGKRQDDGDDTLSFSFSLFPSRVAWLTLDATDDDPKRFWLYLIAALDALHPGLGMRALELLSAAPAISIEAALTVLLNTIAERSERLIIVLDNYDAITTPAIHQALSFLVEYLPPQLHLVLAGRTTPPLPIARLRARAELSELGAIDLRVTPNEAAVLLQQKMGLDLTSEDVAALTARTDGWITGLHLAGLARQQEPERGARGATVHGSDRYLFDYLIEEVLKQQPQAIQTFLLRTSLLDRLNAELCDAVVDFGLAILDFGLADDTIQNPNSKIQNSQAMLEQLEHANLFIIPLDEQRRWYRYHPLFREALQTYLYHTDPGSVPTLQQRAADWHLAHGKRAALPYAVAARELLTALPTTTTSLHASVEPPMGAAAIPSPITFPLAPSPAAAPPQVEPLSEREFDVLCLLADGLSNQQIARRLMISIGTVKTHLINLYGKLEVHSRMQAVARARALRLI
jgi:LuxR family maltose regulon positive regulatory protein